MLKNGFTVRDSDGQVRYHPAIEARGRFETWWVCWFGRSWGSKKKPEPLLIFPSTNIVLKRSLGFPRHFSVLSAKDLSSPFSPVKEEDFPHFREPISHPKAIILINEPELKITYQGQIAQDAWSKGCLGLSSGCEAFGK